MAVELRDLHLIINQLLNCLSKSSSIKLTKMITWHHPASTRKESISGNDSGEYYCLIFKPANAMIMKIMERTAIVTWIIIHLIMILLTQYFSL